MPATYCIRPELELIHGSFFGVVTEAEVDEYYRTIMADSAYHTNYKHLLDTRQATKIKMSSNYVCRLAHRGYLSPGARQAIVANTNSAYGLSRMYISWHPRSKELQVFRSYKDAWRWLKLPIEAMNEAA